MAHMSLVTYEREDGIGRIHLDDGKMNVMSPAMQAAIGDALDQAERDDVVVVFRGRPGVFSAGFDLGILRGDDTAPGTAMVLGGFELAARVLSHPRPVVVACTGHAVAMGLFLTLACDYRIGLDAPHRLTANEVAIGLTLPRAAEELLRHRLTPSALDRAALLALDVGPADAVRDGVLDEVVAPDVFDVRVEEVARSMCALEPVAQRTTKARVRSAVVGRLRTAISLDRADYARRAADSATSSR